MLKEENLTSRKVEKLLKFIRMIEDEETARLVEVKLKRENTRPKTKNDMRETDLLRQKAASTRHRPPRNPVSGPRCQPFWKGSSIGKPEKCLILPVHYLQLNQRNSAFKSHKDNDGFVEIHRCYRERRSTFCSGKVML